MRLWPAIHVRVFLGSPDDVDEERKAAMDVVRTLPEQSMLRGKLTTTLYAWSPEATPMEVHAHGQAAVVTYVGRPSECDLAVIILGSRLGTPLPADELKTDGTRYGSGTVWELEDARRARKPVFLYVRRQLPPPRDEAEEKDQRSLTEFLASLNDADGSMRGGRNEYASVGELRAKLQKHLEAFLARHLARKSRARAASAVAVLAALVAAVSVAAGHHYGAKPVVTLREVPPGVVDPASHHASVWISYTVQGAKADDRCVVQVAEASDPTFEHPLPAGDCDLDGRGRRVAVQFRVPQPRDAVPWMGWLRVALARGDEIFTRSAARRVEATRAADASVR
jgi:hypothetical protein